MANRNIRQGGGLALICRSHYRVKECGKGINQTFEYAVWQLHPNNISLKYWQYIIHLTQILTNQQTVSS